MSSQKRKQITKGAMAAIILVLIEMIVSTSFAQDCEPKTISNMDSTTGWNIFTDGEKGSTIVLTSVPGVKNFGIEMAFDIKEEYGYVGISRRIEPDTLLGTTGIKFSYKGQGERENLEFKLKDTEGTYYWLKWNGATVVDDWITIEVPYSDIVCLSCTEKKNLDITKVERIEFAISNDAGRKPGNGSVVIDELMGLTC